MDRIKKDKDDEAAWPSSRPLFNSLRCGCDELDKKAAELREARDTIKDLHVTVDGVAFGQACGAVSNTMVVRMALVD